MVRSIVFLAIMCGFVSVGVVACDGARDPAEFIAQARDQEVNQ